MTIDRIVVDVEEFDPNIKVRYFETNGVVSGYHFTTPNGYVISVQCIPGISHSTHFDAHTNARRGTKEAFTAEVAFWKAPYSEYLLFADEWPFANWRTQEQCLRLIYCVASDEIDEARQCPYWRD